jgi:hypothetical protein
MVNNHARSLSLRLNRLLKISTGKETSCFSSKKRSKWLERFLLIILLSHSVSRTTGHPGLRHPADVDGPLAGDDIHVLSKDPRRDATV